MDFFRNLSIRHKLLVNLANITFVLLVILLVQLWNQNHRTQLHHLLLQTENLLTDVLMLRRNEKDFLARHDLKYLDQFNDNANTLLTHSESVQTTLNDMDILKSEITSFIAAVKDYQQKFNQLVQEQQRIGLHPKDGFYGELRNAVHQIETDLKNHNNNDLLADMLQLRRNEKDFMLRRDAKYIDRFNNNVAIFEQEIRASELNSTIQNRLIALLSTYQSKFSQLVNAETRIGLDHKSGLLGELRKTIQQTESLIEQLVETEKETINKQIRTDDIIMVTVFIVMALSIIVLNICTSRSIIRPVLSLNRAIANIRDNNDFTLRAKYQGNDELAHAAKDFNSLMDDFQALIGQVNTALTTLDEATKNLQENSRQSQEDMHHQHMESDQVATASTELQASFTEVANNTTLAVEKAEQNAMAANDGQEVVNIAVRDINELSQQLVDSSEVINNLAEDSQNIGSVLDVIRSIAEQTNLLALNAAIEAARAGEQGRGFAVVADEVRSLAMRTQESTSEIAAIIESLQNRTETIVTVMQSCREKGDDAATQAAQAGERLHSINAGMTEILDMSTQISTAAEEQTSVMASVSESIVSIRDIASRANNLTEENVDMSASIAEQAANLKGKVSQYKA